MLPDESEQYQPVFDVLIMHELKMKRIVLSEALKWQAVQKRTPGQMHQVFLELSIMFGENSIHGIRR